MRIPIYAGNWKMNKGPSEAKAFADSFSDILKGQDILKEVAAGKAELVLFPPALSIGALKCALKDMPVALGAQNCYYEPSGAFTGELSVPMIEDAGCEYILIGHSERRHVFGENDALISKKLKAIAEGKAKCMLCVGEVEGEREANKQNEVVAQQLDKAFAELVASASKQAAAELLISGRIVIAYEPVWAIGTGKTATDADAQAMCAYARTQIEQHFGAAAAEAARILYGGSVKPGNTAGLMSQPDIDGLLIGGASWEAASYADVIKAGLGL